MIEAKAAADLAPQQYAHPQYVGSFAPPIDDDALYAYSKIGGMLTGDNQIHRAYVQLVSLVAEYKRFNCDAKKVGIPHPCGVGMIKTLTETELSELASLTPTLPQWETWAGLFDQLAGEQRKAAFHLLWFARELMNGRQPITTDQL